MIKNLLCLFNVLLLSACVSVSESSLVVPAAFEVEATVITYQEPAWRISASVYEQKLGKYQVVDANVSWESTDSTFKDYDIKFNSFLNWALLGESLRLKVQQWDTTTRQRYSFRLDSQDSEQYLSRCEISTQGLSKKINNAEINNQILDTRLVCQIANSNGTWNLLIEKLNASSRIARFWQENKHYDIKFSKEILYDQQLQARLADKRIPWHLDNRLAGVFLYETNKLVSANALVGQPKVWLHNTLTEQENTLLLSVNYAISMYDWLSDELIKN